MNKLESLIEECIKLLQLSGINSKQEVLIKLIEFKECYLDE